MRKFKSQDLSKLMGDKNISDILISDKGYIKVTNLNGKTFELKQFKAIPKSTFIQRLKNIMVKLNCSSNKIGSYTNFNNLTNVRAILFDRKGFMCIRLLRVKTVVIDGFHTVDWGD